jgi:hypothetical protein
MCVTNIAKRRNVALANASAMVSKTPSLISQRLMGNFMPLMMNNAMAKPLPGTDSTCDTVEAPHAAPQTSALNSFLQEQPVSCGMGSNDFGESKRPKRRRKPQKPGKTAKHNDRHFVVHNYHDHALDHDDENDDSEHEETGGRRRGGVSISFPTKLYSVLEQVEADGWGHVISWMPHGRCFVIHKPKEFSELVMPHYFRQSKLTSFQRQLNLYGFCRLTRGNDAGGYYHELFLRGRMFLAKKMQRTKIKGTKFKAASSPEHEPDFYCMVSNTIRTVVCGNLPISCISPFEPSSVYITQPPVLPSAPVSDDDSDDDSALVGRRSPVGFTPGNGYFNTGRTPGNGYFNTGHSSVSPSTVSIEPLPLQVPQTRMVPSLNPYPIMNGAANMISSNTLQMSFMFASAFSGRSNADQVLDDAVDELFNDASNMVELEQGGDVAQMWDTTEFGQESREDDLHLGFLLDKLLEN